MTSIKPILILVFSFAFALLGNPAFAQEMIWSGTTNKKWNTKSNWSNPNRVPNKSDTVVFSNQSGNTEIEVGEKSAVGSLLFRPAKIAYFKLTGGSVVLSDGGRISFLKLPNDVGREQNASAVIDSDLVMSGDLILENRNRHYLGGEYLRINGSISGAGNISVEGARNGLVQLCGNNSSFSGGIVIKSGGIKLSHANGIGVGVSPVQLEGGIFVIGARVSTRRDFEVNSDSILDSHGPNGTHDGTFTIKKGATLKITNGGGNTMTLRGPITGGGRLEITARGTTFAGSKPNRLTGVTVISGDRGPTIFGKKDGIDVVAGGLELKGNGTIRWDANEQIANDAPIKFVGKSPTLELNGKRESLGPLNLQSDGRIFMGADSGRIRFANSSRIAWNTDSSILIFQANDFPGQITFGDTEQGLTAAQIRQIGFVDPAGHPAGTYSALINNKGELSPHRKVVPVNLPFDNSEKARNKRRALYQSAGLERISKLSPKIEGGVISVFGDSITWGGGYVNLIRKAVANKLSRMKIINHGCNGAGVKVICDGDQAKIHVGNTSPKPFLETIESDGTSVAVIFIGVNDVWWRKTSPEEFENGLRDIVKHAKSRKIKVVMATLALLKEKVGARNPKCDRFAEITRKVCRETESTLVDLRTAFFACLENESITVKPNGQWTSHPNLLTHDGVHMNSKGNKLIANLIADGICNSLEK